MSIVPIIKSKVLSLPIWSQGARRFLEHPAGPFTIHFWAPTWKWGIIFANITDFAIPPENISTPQQIAISITGCIWARYSTVIDPVNWNLFAVNFFMALSGIYQLSRKLRQQPKGDKIDEKLAESTSNSKAN